MKPKHVLAQLDKELVAFRDEADADTARAAEQGGYYLAAATSKEAAVYNRVLCRLRRLMESE